MITQSKVNSAISKVSSTNEKMSEDMNNLQNKVFQSRSWWQGSDHDSFLEKYQNIRSLNSSLQKELNTLKGQLRILLIEVANEEWKRKQAQNKK